MIDPVTVENAAARLAALREICTREGFIRDASRRLEELRGLYDLGAMVQRAREGLAPKR